VSYKQVYTQYILTEDREGEKRKRKMKEKSNNK
jgi:hypothetical protein